MTEYDRESASIPERPLRDDLPPVQPPSAGFIVQLFIFPALIVMAVVAIWWMFGLIALGEQDWHKLVQELQSPNLHIRNRAMYGLAQVMIQDSRRGQQGQNLRANREIAQGLTDQLILELRKNSVSRDGVAIQEYLTHALGMMDLIEVTGPALYLAMEPHRDIDIRKSAVISLSLVAGRAFDLKQPLGTAEGVEALIRLSTDSLPVLRQSAAFALGLFDSPEATHQLEVLLGDSDQLTRVNAAIGLARHDSTAGYQVIIDSLKFSNVMKLPITAIGVDEKSTAAGEQFLVVKNLLNAVTSLVPRFNDEQRHELIPLVEQLSNDHAELRIRIDAATALNKLKEAAAEK